MFAAVAAVATVATAAFTSAPSPIAITPTTAPAASIDDTAETEHQRQLDLLCERVRDETLEYHLTHRPKNTAKNYIPKQREWYASSLPFLLNCILFG